jgi:hypothetical protein
MVSTVSHRNNGRSLCSQPTHTIVFNDAAFNENEHRYQSVLIGRIFANKRQSFIFLITEKAQIFGYFLHCTSYV